MTASIDELTSELVWSRNRLNSLSRGVEPPHPSEWDPTREFSRSLTQVEVDRLAEYERTAAERGCCHNLGNDPFAGRGISSTPTELHAMLAHPHLNYLTRSNRWLAPSEVLVSLGFPLDPWLVNPHSGIPHKCCSFAVPRQRNRLVVQHQAGNSMNVNVAMVVILYALVYVKLGDASFVARLARDLSM